MRLAALAGLLLWPFMAAGLVLWHRWLFRLIDGRADEAAETRGEL